MAKDTKPQAQFLGHPILDESHAHQLHLDSAIGEFHLGLPRAEAEKRALENYRREHHSKAAAHHLDGLKLAQAMGDSETAQRHSVLYSLHTKALGEDPYGAVPESVRKHRGFEAQDKDKRRLYRFKGHDADQFLVQPISKSEGNVVDALLAASNKVSDIIVIPAGVDEYLRELAGEEQPKEPVKVEPVEVKKSDPVLQAAAQLKKTLGLIELTKKAIEALRVQGM